MIEIKTFKEPDGWRVAITDGSQTVILDDLYEDEAEARLNAVTLI